MTAEELIDARAKQVHQNHRLISENHTRNLLHKHLARFGQEEEVLADLNAGRSITVYNPNYPNLPIHILAGEKFILIHSYLYMGGDGYITVFPSKGIIHPAAVAVGQEYSVKDSQTKRSFPFWGDEVYEVLVYQCGMTGDDTTSNRILLARMFQTAYDGICAEVVRDAEAEGLISEKIRKHPNYPSLSVMDKCSKEMISLHPECRDKQEGLYHLALALAIVNTADHWHPEAIKRTAEIFASLCKEAPQLSDGAMLLRYINQEKPVKQASIQAINAIPAKYLDTLDLQLRSAALRLKLPLGPQI